MALGEPNEEPNPHLADVDLTDPEERERLWHLAMTLHAVEGKAIWERLEATRGQIRREPRRESAPEDAPA